MSSAFSVYGDNDMTEKEWINLIAGDAQRAANSYGYLPSVLIAQTCQETGYGSTDLSQVGRYNVVGMKKELLNSTWTSNHWHGKTYSKRTPEWYGGKKTYITDVFRVYDSYYDGLADYCQFMRDARYSPGGDYKYRDLLGTKDPYTLIEGVRSRGYCTDPGYTTAVMRIIEKHNLTQYDQKGETKKVVEKPYIIDRIAENEWQVPYHNANDAEYLAIHYLGVNGENPDLYNHGYGGHFYVSKTGQCYQAAKVSDEIWHVGKGGYQYIHPDARNYNTIGIECATYTASGRDKDEETWYFTKETQEACAKLAAWIMDHYKIPMDHLLRHGDITTKNCPSPYKRDQGKGSNWTWEQFKDRVAYYLNGKSSGTANGIYVKLGGSSMTYKIDTVRKGSKGTSVLLLQEILKARGYYKGNLDKNFGDVTYKAVMAYQADRIKAGAKIGGADGKPDGVVGSGTWHDLLVA